VIRSFHHAGTEDIFDGADTTAARKRCPQQLWSVARRKLDMVNAAPRLGALRVPPGNKLERLKDERVGQWAIRVNNQYRVCFRWEDDGAHDVEVES
jgi:proteic killer suppression protein